MPYTIHLKTNLFIIPYAKQYSPEDFIVFYSVRPCVAGLAQARLAGIQEHCKSFSIRNTYTRLNRFFYNSADEPCLGAVENLINHSKCISILLLFFIREVQKP